MSTFGLGKIFKRHHFIAFYVTCVPVGSTYFKVLPVYLRIYSDGVTSEATLGNKLWKRAGALTCSRALHFTNAFVLILVAESGMSIDVSPMHP